MNLGRWSFWQAGILATLVFAGSAACRPTPRTVPTATPREATPTGPVLPTLEDPVVWVVGPVRWPVLDWRKGLTLAEAILMADYLPATDPSAIILHRGSIAIPIDLARLLDGEDWALLPGDRIEIRP